MFDGIHVIVVEGCNGLLKSKQSYNHNSPKCTFLTMIHRPRRLEHPVKASTWPHKSDNYKAVHQNKCKMSFLFHYLNISSSKSGSRVRHSNAIFAHGEDVKASIWPVHNAWFFYSLCANYVLRYHNASFFEQFSKTISWNRDNHMELNSHSNVFVIIRGFVTETREL